MVARSLTDLAGETLGPAEPADQETDV